MLALLRASGLTSHCNKAQSAAPTGTFKQVSERRQKSDGRASRDPSRKKKVRSVITCAALAHRCPNGYAGESLTNDEIPDHFSGLLGYRYRRPGIPRLHQSGRFTFI
jgi:hypothetical protein